MWIYYLLPTAIAFFYCTLKKGIMRFMKLINCKKEIFINLQEEFKWSNFLQSNEIYELQVSRNNYLFCERLALVENEEVVGLAVINYAKKWRYFKQAFLIHGPLLKNGNSEQRYQQAIKLIEEHVRTKKALSLMIHPNQIRTYNNENLQVISQNNHAYINEFLLDKGYLNYYDTDFLLEGDNQNFIKDLRSYNSYKELVDSFSPVLIRNIKKSKEAYVKVRELDESEIYHFYQILAKTAKRRNFSIPDKQFFQQLKTNFGSRAKFMFAYLECKPYEKSLNDQIVDFTKRIVELKQKPDSKKRNVAIKNTKQKLNSYHKRLQDFHSFQINSDILPLSSYLFIEHGNQLLSYFGGNLEEYLVFGGATMINIEMLTYAVDHRIDYFNFGGTIETDKSKEGIGNFNYKKQFGGQLCQYWGSYTKGLTRVGNLAVWIKIKRLTNSKSND